MQVRVLSNNHLPFSFSKSQYRKLDLSQLPEKYEYLLNIASDYNIQVDEQLNNVMKTLKGFKEEKPVKPVTKVVIHIHGGGFLTMSSGSHQVYTRTWANKLDCPIFSIDYRLSPEYKYPAAIDDVWQVYTWIVKYSFIQLGILPEKIVVVGDSAGGNLVAAITMLAIQYGYRRPDQLILAYPALVMSKSYVFPSMIYSLIDPILSTNFLEVCLESYLSEE